MSLPLTNRQLEGSIVLVVITSVIYATVFFLYRYPSQGASIPYGDGTSCPVIVELTGDTDHKGIYFVPENTTISDFLKIAKVEDINDLEKRSVKLSTGLTVNIGNQLSLGEISAAKRLLLNIPIDINRASLNDLMFVPGIGEKTAWRIIHLRESSGRLQKIEDLMKIPGIKEKRLAQIKEYLYVDVDN